MDSSSKKEVIQGISSYIPILDLKLVKKMLNAQFDDDTGFFNFLFLKRNENHNF